MTAKIVFVLTCSPPMNLISGFLWGGLWTAGN